MLASGTRWLTLLVGAVAMAGCSTSAGLLDSAPCQPEAHTAAPGAHDRFSFESAGGLYGYRTGFGSVAIEPRFVLGYEFSLEGIAGAVDPIEGPVFIDVNGRIVAHAYPVNKEPDYFQEGKARIVSGGLIGYIDRAGSVLVAPRFDQAAAFCNGAAEVCFGCQDSGGDRFQIDETGARLPGPS